jgi:hypothetical protein
MVGMMNVMVTFDEPVKVTFLASAAFDEATVLFPVHQNGVVPS